jgi:hypothetical protein
MVLGPCPVRASLAGRAVWHSARPLSGPYRRVTWQ